MCDYSMLDVVSRPGRIGDYLITTSFTTTATRGFAAVGAPSVAVCLLPGTELAFDDPIDWDWPLRYFFRKKTAGKLVRFRQINVDRPNCHHDAVEFPNGKIILLTDLCEGQKAKVLQVPAGSGLVQRISQLANAPEPRGQVIDLVPSRVDQWWSGY
ncbi:MAG TPA: hypothetical protein VMU69_04775 [Bradyrhizobium sp.]|nr:hypothetical protein [Bradyrhizobium sp.]